MKIGIDGRLWGESGVGRYIRNLVINLSKIDSKNNYYLFVPPKFVPDINLGSKWTIVPTDIHWHSLSEQIQFPLLLNKYSLDLMHFTYFSSPIFYRKPYVITIHDLVIHHFSTGKSSTHPEILYKTKVLGYKFIIKSSARQALKIISVSSATKAEIIDHLKIDPDKINVVYEAAENLPDLGDRFTKIKLPEKYFLYVGNAYPHKNLETLLHAFSKLGGKYRDLKLVLAGRRDYFYKRLLLELNNESVIFVTPDDSELKLLYKNALALIMPSKMEGFGLPVLEAMANDCLVVCSDIPSFKEICNNAAIYFDPFDTESIIKALEDVLEIKPARKKQIIQDGVSRARKFSFRKMAQETLKIYEDSISLRQGK